MRLRWAADGLEAAAALRHAVGAVDSSTRAITV
jgi:hypothetical protein